MTKNELIAALTPIANAAVQEHLDQDVALASIVLAALLGGLTEARDGLLTLSVAAGAMCVTHATREER